MRHYPRVAPVLARCFGLLALITCLQTNSLAQPGRIAQRIDPGRRFTLSGDLHPLARSDNDHGRADPALRLEHVTLVFKPSDSQAADLDRLLADLHDPGSANYHNWLTPEAYADRFGMSQSDIDAVVAWLGTQQLTVTAVARARNAVTLSGAVDRIEGAFGTEIHTYLVDGETHYANATAPTPPAALQGVLQSIRGLHDFRLRARIRGSKKLALSADGVTPQYTSQTSGNHYLAPDDFATIFNIKSLYSTGIDGSGQTVAIVGQSRIDTSHLTMFRSYFGLSAANLTTQLVPNTRDPGTSASDAEESDLDLEWASAVARRATLLFVYSYDVTDAVQYVIDQNLAPVLSMSYGACEGSSSASDALTLQTWAKQGNTQGITWVAASGDSGATDCYHSSGGPFGRANSDLSLSTDLPASIPEVTGVGGTELNEAGGTYWDATNNSTTKASARAYIPETAWNDSTTDSPAASGGGASRFFAKPSWQTGTGVPADGARDVPDVAFPGSADHDGYMVYTTSNRQTGWYVFGGTSAGAPVFSGMLALLNHYSTANGYQSNSGLGNVNTRLYNLAESVPSAFHDIITGDNTVTATVCSGFRCSSSSTQGYSANVGYDRVTGLGSIDIFSLVTGWQQGSHVSRGVPTVTVSASPASLTALGNSTLTALVTGAASATPTGTVTFLGGGTTLGIATLAGTSATATATLTISGSAAGLASGGNTITAAYSGDSGYSSAAGTTTLTLVNSSEANPVISGAVNAASFQNAYAPGMILSIFGTLLALTTRSVGSAPLPTTLDNVSVTRRSTTSRRRN